MKAILEFNLPEDRSDYLAAYQATNFRSAIQNYENWLKSEIKHSEVTPDAEACRSMLLDCISGEGVDLYE